MIQEGIYNALKNDPTIAGLVEGVYPIRVPQTKLKLDKDFITYSKVSGSPDKQIGYQRDVFQINIVSKNYSTLQTLSENVCRVLQSFIGNLGNKQLVDRTVEMGSYEDFDDKSEYYIKPIEFKFIYK